MIRSSLLVGALGMFACASSSPPAGPKHVPADSAESKTACPELRATAQTARENLLGEDLGGESGVQLNRAAAKSVFLHAECEAAALRGIAPPSGTHDQILSGLRAIRQQMQDANNLFQEVSRYDQGAFAVRASLGEASLRISYAKTVSSLTPPADLESKGRDAFESELADASRVLRLEASGILELALDTITTTTEASELKPQACELWAAASTSANAHCP